MGTKSNAPSANLDNRFQIHDHEGSGSITLASFATREEADEALRTMRSEDSVSSASYVIADVGPRDPEAKREDVIAAAKTAEQKEADRLAQEAKNAPQA